MASRSPSCQSRSISGSDSSRRASRSWCLTRNWLKPSVRRKASASSTRLSLSTVMGSPYWKREERQAKDGLSHVGSPAARDRARTSSFHRSEEHTSELQSQPKLLCPL